jgi:hypothetical protein
MLNGKIDRLRCGVYPFIPPHLTSLYSRPDGCRLRAGQASAGLEMRVTASPRSGPLVQLHDPVASEAPAVAANWRAGACSKAQPSGHICGIEGKSQVRVQAMLNAVRQALHTAAGELQADAAEIGPAYVTEADMRRALRRGLQMQLGPVVRPEGASGFSLADWPGGLRGPDLVIESPGESHHAALVELKWCREDKVYEIFWDACKLALALRAGKATSAYIAVAAPVTTWIKSPACGDLLSTGVWETAGLFRCYDREWRWLLGGNKTARPIRLPAEIKTVSIDALPIHLTAGDWELRAASVEPRGDGWLPLRDGWPEVVRSM